MSSTPKNAELNQTLQARLASLLDLQMTLKHIHWNVVGPNFISVHEMLDDFVTKVRPMSDAAAERIRTMGGEPLGTPGAVTSIRTWDDYDINRASTVDHLRALDLVFSGIIGDHRSAITQAAAIDPITEDLLIAQTAELELMQWFVTSFLENAGAETFGFADREPTDAERAAAAENGDVDAKTAEHYDEMNKIGANAKGEGAIT